MTSLFDLTEKVLAFRRERDWEQFHNPKDIALSMVLEVAELVEHFQWKNQEQFEEYLKSYKEEIGDELSDVLYWVLLLAHDLGIDLPTAFEQKLVKNAEKYPTSQSKGTATKYTKL